MPLHVVGAGVGRTGSHSLKAALEALLGGTCHHMVEVLAHPEEIPVWTDAIEGRPVDWDRLMAPYVAQVDWPGASFWPELLAANPDALVILSVRDPESWYTSATNTIFQGLDRPDVDPWMSSMRHLLGDRFCNDFADKAAMIAAFDEHNNLVRRQVRPDRLLEWTAGDGWEPICAALGRPVPDEPFPHTNTTEEFRSNVGLPPLGGPAAGNRPVTPA